MWQTFAVGHGEVDATVPELWQAAAEALAANRNWDMLDLSSPAGLACFARVAPNEIVPEDMALKAFNLGSPVWSEVPVAALPPLLLLQNYLQLAYAHKTHSVVICERGAAEVIAENMAKFKQHSHPVSEPAATCSGHTRALRSALLLLKLVSALASFKVENDRVYAAIKAIWTAIGFIADHKISQQAAKLISQPQTRAEAEARPEGVLSRMLIQLVLPVIKLLLKTDTEAAYQCICCACKLIMGLMPKTKPALCHLVASEIVSKGDIWPCSFLLLRMDILSHCMDILSLCITLPHSIIRGMIAYCFFVRVAYCFVRVAFA